MDTKIITPVIFLHRYDPEEMRFWLFEANASAVVVQEKLPGDLKCRLDCYNDVQRGRLRAHFQRILKNRPTLPQDDVFDSDIEKMQSMCRVDLDRLTEISWIQPAGVILNLDERTYIPSHLDHTQVGQVLLHRHLHGPGIIGFNPKTRIEVQTNGWGQDILVNREQLNHMEKGGEGYFFEMIPGYSVYFTNRFAHGSHPSQSVKIRTLTL